MGGSHGSARGARAAMPHEAERRCGRFGCLEPTATTAARAPATAPRAQQHLLGTCFPSPPSAAQQPLNAPWPPARYALRLPRPRV
jgi:hypothetical protein